MDGAKIAKAEDLKKDEYVLVYMSGKDNTSVYNDYARFDVVKIFDAEILSDIGITKWSRSDTKVSGDFTADGTEVGVGVLNLLNVLVGVLHVDLDDVHGAAEREAGSEAFQQGAGGRGLCLHRV